MNGRDFLMILVLVIGLIFSAIVISCGDDDDDDDSGDDCITCESTSECTEALGSGWACQGGCCKNLGDDDDDTGDDDDDDDDDDSTPGDISWEVEQIDRSGGGNRQMNIILTDDSTIHMTYTGCTDASCARNELIYTTNSAKGDWQITSVDAQGNDTGWFPSMVFDDFGNMTVFYNDHEDTKLKMATKPASGSWSNEYIGSLRGGFWTSCAYAGSDLYMAHTYFGISGIEGDLQVGLWQGSAWSFDNVDTEGDGGWFTKMVVTPDNRPVISYVVGYPNGYAKLAEWDGSAWQLTQYDAGSFGGDMAIDTDGYYHIVYPKPDPKNSNLWDLWYSTNSPDGNWTKLSIDPGINDDEDTGGFPSIAIDEMGGLHVTYRNFTQNALYYMRKAPGGEWEQAVADSIGGGMYSDTFIDANGAIHAVYENGQNVFYAVCETCAVYN